MNQREQRREERRGPPSTSRLFQPTVKSHQQQLEDDRTSEPPGNTSPFVSLPPSRPCSTDRRFTPTNPYYVVEVPGYVANLEPLENLDVTFDTLVGSESGRSTPSVTGPAPLVTTPTLPFNPTLNSTMEGLNQRVEEVAAAMVATQQENAKLLQEIAQLRVLVNNHEHAKAVADGVKTGMLKPHPFGRAEGESWLDFRRQFEHSADFNGWNNRQQKLALVQAMTGKAAGQVRDLKVDQFQTPQEMLNAFEKRFLPAATSDIVRIQFDRCRQMPRESVLDYHARLRDLYRRAYPKSTDDTQLIRRFAFGLANTWIQQMVLRHRAETYDGVLEVALNESAVVDVSDALRPGASALFTEGIRTGANGSSQQSAPYSDTNGEPMEIGAINNNECLFCGRSGHWKSSCTLWQKARKMLLNRKNNGGNRGRGGFRGGFRGRGKTFRGRGRTAGDQNERPRHMFKQMIAALQAQQLESTEDDEAATDEQQEQEAEPADLDELIASLTEEEIDQLMNGEDFP